MVHHRAFGTFLHNYNYMNVKESDTMEWRIDSAPLITQLNSPRLVQPNKNTPDQRGLGFHSPPASRRHAEVEHIQGKKKDL